jgi:two-component system, OmpR family, sensor kinase
MRGRDGGRAMERERSESIRVVLVEDDDRLAQLTSHRIQQLVLAEKELLANVSHELRTPLARIRVALDMAAEGNAAAASASLAEITTDLTELEALLDDVLQATRLAIDDGTSGAPGFALHLEDVSVEAIAQAATQRFKSRHPQRPLRTSVEGGATLLFVDMLIRRALDNLLDNAHKYSPDPEGAIVLLARHEAGRVLFEVVDCGIGIETEDIPHVFKPFFRSDRSRSRDGGGIGLGLTLAKRIVEAHGGTIEVHSEAGVGTTVRVGLEVSETASSGVRIEP